MIDYPIPSTFREYQLLAKKTDQTIDGTDVHFVFLGLFGEVGSVLSAVKKLGRDTIVSANHRETIIEEIGDSLWYLAAIASREGKDFDDFARDVAKKKGITFDKAGCVKISDLDHNRGTVIQPETPEYRAKLENLSNEVSYLIYWKRRFGAFGFSRRMITIFDDLIKLIHISDLTIQEVLNFNVRKTFSRWNPDKVNAVDGLFEPQEIPYFERLPRKMEISIFEPERGVVIQRYNQINIGDRLTDNIFGGDDYRFHDVFHYAYASVLHWSPVTRALLKLKRKSNDILDQNEDGARAILIEEGIAAFVFNLAKLEYEFFEGVPEGKLNFDILKIIEKLVKGYEVDKCPLWLWERAILQGFEAFRFLQKNKRGIITMDLDNRTLSIKELK